MKNEDSKCTKTTETGKTRRAAIVAVRRGKTDGTQSMKHGNKKESVPLNQKVTLSIDETVAYTGIGRDALRQLTSREDCPFVLWIGRKRLIKRKVFEEYIEKVYSI